ncbi:MAG TPA: cation:proton antiporter [Candidatus Binatia bacterium]|nr:cation:proton antiporter [Candidatus Binatia bacterium]
MQRGIAIYVLAVAATVLAVTGLLQWGGSLHPAASAIAPSAGAEGGLAAHFRQPLTLLLLQIVVVLSAARLCGFVIGRFGQPAVMGEILAGVLLGPSLLGLVWPEATATLFPPASLPALSLFGQIGALLFLFVVGLELDLEKQGARARTSIAVSHAGIALPFLLGVGLAIACFRNLAPPTVPFLPFALFLGIAMSVTAFPVLARILQERNLQRSELGQTALSCAAIGDLLAWSLLAVVVAIVRARGLGDAAWTLGLALAFAAAMIVVVRPPLARLVARYYVPGGRPGYPLIAGMLIFAFVSATLTDLIGIHGLFGAFLAGTLVSGHRDFRQYLHDRVLPLSSLIMLPLFFALVGLRTRIGLLDGAGDWLLCGLIIVVAMAGKLGGCMLAARWSGMAWRDSLALGTLMNTRGLMELIVLNIGYDLGILSPRAFTMLVIMALVTTLMTGPLLTLIQRRK